MLSMNFLKLKQQQKINPECVLFPIFFPILKVQMELKVAEN